MAGTLSAVSIWNMSYPPSLTMLAAAAAGRGVTPSPRFARQERRGDINFLPPSLPPSLLSSRAPSSSLSHHKAALSIDSLERVRTDEDGRTDGLQRSCHARAARHIATRPTRSLARSLDGAKTKLPSNKIARENNGTEGSREGQ